MPLRPGFSPMVVHLRESENGRIFLAIRHSIIVPYSSVTTLRCVLGFTSFHTAINSVQLHLWSVLSQNQSKEIWLVVRCVLFFFSVICVILNLGFSQNTGYVWMFEDSVLRRLFAPKREEVTGNWREWLNEALHCLYSSLNIRMIKSMRILWMGHAAQMGDISNVITKFWSENRKGRT
jgi:hypothetical protein